MATFLDRVAGALGYTKTRELDTPIADWLSMTATEQRWNMPEPMTAEAQLSLYSKLSWVHIAISLVAQTAATTKLSVKEMAGEDENDLVNHPFELLLQRPNPLQSRYELLESTFAFRALTGNAYWWLNRPNENAEPSEIWVLSSEKVQPVPDERMYLRGYTYEVDGKKIPLELHEVVHFRRFNPLNPFVGSSPLDSLRMATATDLAQQRWNMNFFDKDNAKVPGALAFASPIADPEWERMKADIKREHGGTKRNMMMLRNVGTGGVQWVQMAMSHTDMEFLNSRIATKEEIFSVYAPGAASLLAVNATEANAVAGKKTFIEHGVWPQLVAIAEKITNDVLDVYGKNLRAEFDDIRIADRVMELQEQGAFGQVATVDEIRKKYYGLDPLGDDRGRLLPAEVGKGLTRTEEPQTQAQSTVPFAAALPQETQALHVEPGHDAYAEHPHNKDSADNLEMTAAKRAEVKAFKKWYKRKPNRDVAQFESEYLTDEDKRAIVAEMEADDDADFFTMPDIWTGNTIPEPADSIAAWKAMVLTLGDGGEDDDAEQRARDAIERAAADNIEESLRRQQREITRIARNLDANDFARWANEDLNAAFERSRDEYELYDMLRRALLQSVDLGVSVAVAQFDTIGFGFDWTLSNDNARRWAEQYTGELIRGINATSLERTRRAVAAWVENGESLGALIEDLTPIFGRGRAELIASTEVTRAYAQGTLQSYRDSGVVQEWEWSTSRDERTCPQCGPRHGRRAPLGQGIDGLSIPAHPRCRCWWRPVLLD